MLSRRVEGVMTFCRSRQGRPGHLACVALLAVVAVTGCSAKLRDGGEPDAAASGGTNEVGTSAGGTTGGTADVGVGTGGVAGAGKDASADVDARVETGSHGPADTLASASWPIACSAYAKAVCRLAACRLYTIYLIFGSEENCEARYGGVECEAQMTSAGSRVTPSSLSACAQALSAESCGDNWSLVPAECSWQGSLADNSSCTYDQQCQSGLCDLAAGTWCGLCKAKIPAGGSCPITKRECQNGLVCAETLCSVVTDAGICNQGQWVCTMPASEGDACVSPVQCNWGLVCEGGRCVRVKSRGAACADGLECNPEEGLTCLPNPSGSGNSCQPWSWADAGESCNDFAGLECLDSAICKAKDGSGASVGVCSAAAAPEAPCGTDIACQYPARCIGGKCQTASDMASSCK
jgi:hypothetical protein